MGGGGPSPEGRTWNNSCAVSAAWNQNLDDDNDNHPREVSVKCATEDIPLLLVCVRNANPNHRPLVEAAEAAAALEAAAAA